MPTFQYTVRDSTGAVRAGKTKAESQDILRERLQAQGFQVVELKEAEEVPEAPRKKFKFPWSKR